MIQPRTGTRSRASAASGQIAIFLSKVDSPPGTPEAQARNFHAFRRYGSIPYMETPVANANLEHAQQLLSRLAPDQVAAVVHLMDVMLDPVSRALANAPFDGEPVTEEEERAVAESREWFRHNPGIPFEQVVAGLGFTMEEVRSCQYPA
jgi:hypothetical protein